MEINIINSEIGVTVYTKVDGFLSQINTMYVPEEVYGLTGLYVNRIIVNPNLRNRGIATKLLKKLTELVDQKQIKLILEINPYGDLSEKQLKQFYKKHGFEEHTIQGLYIRYPR